jgi:hypothetical protein
MAASEACQISKDELWKYGKGKSRPFAFLNLTPRHEGVMGEWRYSSTHSWARYYMEVSYQLQAPAALPPGKELLLSIG